jgi:hypothetical protein
MSATKQLAKHSRAAALKDQIRWVAVVVDTHDRGLTKKGSLSSLSDPVPAPPGRPTLSSHPLARAHTRSPHHVGNGLDIGSGTLTDPSQSIREGDLER